MVFISLHVLLRLVKDLILELLDMLDLLLAQEDLFAVVRIKGRTLV
jgi:hypothetical protein